MPRIPRKYLIEATEVGVYHCISRCVRRAYLCGEDRYTGKNFDHRKQWIQDRLEFLAMQYGVDVLGFALLSNHLHLVLRNRPDVVAGWSDDEVARRWWNLYPLRRDKDGNPDEPAESDLSMITADAARLAEVRGRLSSLSWFMRCLIEPIARRANKEDSCTGRFWEGRYKCQPILDESALAACLAYVDLNPIRAGIAQTLETSRFTSVFARIRALTDAAGLNAACSGDSSPNPGEVSEAREPESPVGEFGEDAAMVCLPTEMAVDAAPLAAASIETGSVRDETARGVTNETRVAETRKVEQIQAAAHKQRCDAWLSPISLAARAELPIPARRASNKGCLEMSLADYLSLLDWTGRQLRNDKRRAIPAELAPLLDRLQVSAEGWLKMVAGFSRLFRRAAGTPQSLTRDAERRGKIRREGIARSTGVFA